MRNLKTIAPYHPTRTFDDNLEAFTRMATTAGWVFPGFSADQLKADADAQREERTALTKLTAEQARSAKEFAERQHERFRRFSAALNVVRAAYRDDPKVQAQIAQFKRRGKHSKASTLETPIP